MLLMIAGSLIAGVLYLSSLTQNAVIRNSKVERNDYGQDSSSITLDAKNEEGDEIGEFELNIAARQYSKKEADKLFKKASDQLVKQILQDNLSQDEVRTDLYLPDKMDNFPFQISWKLDNYESIHADGKIVKDHASICCDVGQNQMWAAQSLRCEGEDIRILNSGGLFGIYQLYNMSEFGGHIQHTLVYLGKILTEDFFKQLLLNLDIVK